MTDKPRMGRPPIDNPKVAISGRVPPDVAEYLRERGLSVTVEEIVRRTKGFREWKRDRQPV